MLFVPGNDPGKLFNAGIYGADSLVFDLEDAVSVGEKDAARDLVKNVIMFNDYPCEVGVRINHISTPFGYDDLQEIMKARPAFIRVPKSEETADIVAVDDYITQLEKEYGYEVGGVKIVLTIETALGIINSYQLAKSSKRIVAIGLGAEDFAADLETNRTADGREILFARSQLLLSARAAKVQAIDNVYADVANEAGFMADTLLGKELGFSGKSIIHPNQVEIVHRIYTPTLNEVSKAQKIIGAYQEALAKKSGVIALNGKMIDGPIVARAERTLRFAQAVGLVKDGELV
ncbi:MAG: Citryl-CoA lyase [Firmicutes bacterium]|nr:Citryl-CoA lyase [Bacillota bacterium]